MWRYVPMCVHTMTHKIILQLTVLIVCIGTMPSAENDARMADLTLRYVNDSVISLGDVMRRYSLRMSENERRGRPSPTTREEVVAFAKQSLVELTEEELLIQYGRELSEQRGFRLVDHERISQMVMERSKASGRGSSLREQAEERKFIERKQIIDLVLGYFESRVPHIAPEQLEQSYKERQADFRRPARAQVLQLLLRPSSQAERQEVKQMRITVFRRAQDMNDEVIRKASESRIEKYTVSSADEQEKLLAEAVQEIAQQATRTDLDAVAADLAQFAGEVEKRAGALRNAEMTNKKLEDLRLQLVGKDAAAFKDMAKNFSQGPNAVDGGDMGWVESGTYQPAFDKMVFETATVGSISPVFVIDNNAYLIFVTQRIDAHSRSFAEVVGEIESSLRHDQFESVRNAAVFMLRNRASIRDISSIESSIESLLGK